MIRIAITKAAFPGDLRLDCARQHRLCRAAHRGRRQGRIHRLAPEAAMIRIANTAA
jgi:hypothetical protein